MRLLKEIAHAGGSRKKPSPPLSQSNRSVDCKRLWMTVGEALSVLYS